LITALQPYVLPTVSAEPSTTEHNNTERHQWKYIVTRKRQRIRKKSIYFFFFFFFFFVLYIIKVIFVRLY
jgi:hypothetical protein